MVRRAIPTVMFAVMVAATAVAAAAAVASCALATPDRLEVSSPEGAGTDPRKPPPEKQPPPHADSPQPTPFRGRGWVVCLAEEMKRRHKADVQPVHEHLWGFRVDAESAVPVGSYFTLLYTKQSRALFVDERFRQHELILIGRIFPRSQLLEVSGWQWIRGGKRFDVFYWCEVCSIRGVNPSDCACCQAPVELRQVEVPDRKQK